jgi:hypothetical protein
MRAPDARNARLKSGFLWQFEGLGVTDPLVRGIDAVRGSFILCDKIGHSRAADLALHLAHMP